MSEELNKSVCGKQVKCKACGREYRCTPVDDYYNSTTTTDGSCIDCLAKENGCGRVIEPHEYTPRK